MSELTNASNRRGKLLWQLMNTVSALSLIGMVTAVADAKAAQDEDRPMVWMELGGLLQRLNTGEEKYTPPFLLETPRPGPETVSPLSVIRPPRGKFDAEAKIAFQLQGSDWSFSAAIRFGRSAASQHLHEQSHSTGPIAPIPTPNFGPIYQHVFQFIDVKNSGNESHAVLDFQAGKDVGLGMFGAGSSSNIALGVRFAQFKAKSSTAFGSDPDAHRSIKYLTFLPPYRIPILTNAVYHINLASAVASRSFKGVGPSLSWNSSAPFMGNARDGELAFDWGVNAALLFGKQKADVHHQSTAEYHKGFYGYNPRITSFPDPGTDRHRSRTVMVPNAGGFAALTFVLPNCKISAGYRADFFFGAMDGGIDASKSQTRGFYGPYASISIGLGD